MGPHLGPNAREPPENARRTINKWGFAVRSVLTAIGMAFALVGTTGAHAGALSFDFSFSNNGKFSFPSIDGEVTGEIVGLTNNATSAASQVYVFTYPSGLGSSPATPFDATTLPVSSNSFTVVDGVITSGSFFASDGPLALGLLSAGAFNFSGRRRD